MYLNYKKVKIASNVTNLGIEIAYRFNKPPSDSVFLAK